mgnify:CR=1 FL=1
MALDAGFSVFASTKSKIAFFEEKAHVEIAEELDLPLGTVKSRIRLAFKRLRSELGENE